MLGVVLFPKDIDELNIPVLNGFKLLCIPREFSLFSRETNYIAISSFPYLNNH